MNRYLIALCAALTLVSAVRAEGPLAELTVREAKARANYVALNADREKEVFHGEALGRRVWVNSFGSTVSGEGPLGQLTLWYTGSSITGSSGGRPVNLNAFGGAVTGYGPHGYVNLSCSPNSIYGRVGNGWVNISVMGNWANGDFLGRRFNLSGFSNLNVVALAALVGAL